MRINTLIMIVGSFLLLGSSDAAVCQTAPRQKAGITDVEPRAFVSVEFYVRAADKQLVIPVCSDGEGEKPVLCAAILQRFGGKSWHTAKPRISGAVLGMYGKEYWKPVVILPEKEASFQFEFNPDFFGIRKGEHLRIVLDVWESTELMAKSYTGDTRFVSPIFECP